MTTYEIDDHPLWYYDLPHVGRLCEFIRESRHLRAREVAAITGLSESTVSRIEQNSGSAASFEKYVGAFRHGKPPLNPRQIDQLVELYQYSRPRKVIEELQPELAGIDLCLIKSAAGPSRLKELLAELRQERRPAYIRDNLWFIHAYNGAILHLFGVDFSRPENLASWVAWHVIATKFYSNSPVRNMHSSVTDYFPHAVDAFWCDLRRYLFTWQARVLIRAIHQLSQPHGFRFDDWWSQAVTFRLEYELKDYTRALYHPQAASDTSRLIRAQASEPVSVDVPYAEGFSSRFTLAVWNPINAEAADLFRQISARPDARDILFAADYDRGGDIHVNRWPEVRARLGAG